MTTALLITALAGRLPLDLRMENAVVSYARYLGKTLWPFNLAIFYPHPASWPIGLVLLSGLLLLVVSGLIVLGAAKRPWLLVGWLWFLDVLVPFIGLVQVGLQAMADRFMYLPLMGIMIPVIWGAAEMVGWLGCARRWTALVGVLLVVVCGARTLDQLRHWRNTEAVFRHALAVTRDNYLALDSIGVCLLTKTGNKAGHQDVPVTPIEVTSARRVTPAA